MRYSLLIIAILLVSCQSDSPSYFPRKTGLVLKYEGNRGKIESHTDGARVVGELKADVVITTFYPRAKVTNYYQVTDSSFNYLGYEDNQGKQDFSSPEVTFPLPTIVDSEWATDTEFNNENFIMINRIVSISDTVVTKAGTFNNCLRIDSNGQASKRVRMTTAKMSLNITKWYAPNLGLIRFVRKYSTSEWFSSGPNEDFFELVEVTRK